MEYLSLVTGSDGHSRFEEVAVPAIAGERGGSVAAAPIPLSGLVFARCAAGFVRAPHVAPRRQFVVALAGAGEVTTSTGETQRLTVGTVLLAADTTGHGHTTRTVGPDAWQVLWLPLAGEQYAPPAGAITGGLVDGLGGSYVRLHATAAGESAMEDVAVPAVAGADGLQAAALTPMTGLLFRHSPAGYDNAWHNAPRRQFIINLSGGVEIVLSDGRSRRFGPGSLICAEDLTGKGHISRHAGTGERLSLTVPLAE